MTFPDLIGKQKIHGFDLDFDSATKQIVTDFREPNAICNALAFDCSRLATAAFLSMQHCPTEALSTDKVSWALIKAYYAAYYGGHSIMRLTGESCSYLDQSHIARVISLGLAVGKVPSFSLPSTSYHCVLGSSNTIIRSSSLRVGSGGAHEAFWKVFGDRIDALSSSVLSGPLGAVERQDVFGKLQSASRNLRAHNSTASNYLSTIRNEIQYRQGHGVWPPSSYRKSSREQLGRLLLQWHRDPMDIDIDAHYSEHLGRFAITCAFIVALCKILLIRVAERATYPSKSFARTGPLRLAQ